MEKTGFSCYAPAHIVHPSNEGKATTQMFTMKCAVFSSHITVLMSTIQQAKLLLSTPPVKFTLFYIFEGDQVLWTLQSARYMADYA